MTNHWRCSKKFILVGFSLLKVNILEPDVYFINTKNHTKEKTFQSKTKERECIHFWRGKKSMQQPCVIVGSKYCSPNPVGLAIVRKVMKITDGNFVITSADGKLLFKVKDPLFSLHGKRILLDCSGAKVLTLRGKVIKNRAHNLIYTITNRARFVNIKIW